MTLPPYITLPSWTEDDRAAALARFAAEDAAEADRRCREIAAAIVARNSRPLMLSEEIRAFARQAREDEKSGRPHHW